MELLNVFSRATEIKCDEEITNLVQTNNPFTIIIFGLSERPAFSATCFYVNLTFPVNFAYLKSFPGMTVIYDKIPLYSILGVAREFPTNPSYIYPLLQERDLYHLLKRLSIPTITVPAPSTTTTNRITLVKNAIQEGNPSANTPSTSGAVNQAKTALHLTTLVRNQNFEWQIRKKIKEENVTPKPDEN